MSLFGNLRGDLFGGLTAAVVALPLALAFGVSSGAGPVAGLYGAICVGFFAALFGGTRTQVSGPTGPMTVVMTATFMHYTAMFPDDPGRALTIGFTVVIMGGGFQILFGILRLGRYINLVPHPVISGFMSGIGVIIILLQIAPMLGAHGDGGPLAAVKHLPTLIAEMEHQAAILGVVMLAVLYLVPGAVTRWIPAPLLVLALGTGAVMVLGLDQVKVLGDIPSGLPTLQWPDVPLALLPDMIKAALTLAALGAIDSLLTSLVADSITRSRHDSDKELVGQGIGNLVAGLLGGLPGAGATMRTVINVKAGGRTQLSGMLHALVLLAIVLGAGGLASHIPHAVLAAILVKVGTDIIDWDYLKRLRTAPLDGVLMMFTVLFITVFIDLITAVAIGVIMASLFFVKQMTDLQVAGLKVYTDPDEHPPLSEAERQFLRSAAGRVLLYQFGGPMSFGAAKEMVHRLAHFEGYQTLVLDLNEVTSLDPSSSRAMEDIIVDAHNVGRQVYLVGLRPGVKKMLVRQKILQRVPANRRWRTRLQALERAVADLQPLGNPDETVVS